MNQLENTLTSLEVAEMVGREHNNVLKDIRNIIEQIGAVKNYHTYFVEDVYKDIQGKERPCFKLTKKGCELFGGRMSGAKGTHFAMDYIERFNQMEQHIKQQTSNLSPELQMFNQLFQASANVELEQKRQAEKITAVEKSVDNISEIVALSTSDWRKQSQTIIRKIAYKLGAGTAYQEIGKQIYQETERAARCSLKIRLTNMRKTMALEGASKSSRDKKNYLDVIEKDPKLVNIYMHTVKQFAIKYQVDVA
ncbi:Rha family transcriptional regulator [Lactococcus lactis subsp. lactis]|uniref:Rha family transcriptional regulator n=1 Tax=Lactococcus lactis subsp. lactis TaxID=1360 RepID=A0A2Z3KN12_LACLL|nr:Rha family transcriptional regulator [Lactococcus lactis]AWN66984.1 Rha family transcriptional regulator [Lactococcus lactis subsp. lactis]